MSCISGIDIFIAFIVPTTFIALCAAGLWVQAKANRATQVLFKKMTYDQ